MIHVWYSNYVEALVDQLVADLDQGRPSAAAVFEPTRIVVPNWNLETYLKFEIARRRGVAAGFGFDRLERFLGSLLPDDVEVLSAPAAQALLVDVLADEAALGSAELEPVRAYLFAAGSDPDAVALRRFQLAERLGDLFREYGFSRPQMLEAWRAGQTTVTEPGFAGAEVWQRAIWQRVFGEGGRLEQVEAARGARIIRLPQIADLLAADALELPPAIRIFGLSHVAQIFERIFGLLGERTELYIYALNPSGKYWEDLVCDPDEEAKLLSSRAVDDGQLALVADEPADDWWQDQRYPAALELWGRAGRDHVHMLNNLCGHEPAGAFPLPTAVDGDSVLHRLQQDIVELNGSPGPADLGPDASIQILGCPNVGREVEVIANEIWWLVEHWSEISPGSRPLRFNEIAVVVNHERRAVYQTHIQSVFGQVHDIPVSVVDVEAAGHSRMVEAIELLLALPFGEFRRRDLLKLLCHPNVIARFDDVDPGQWMRWCDELHIVLGADREDLGETYLTEDLLHWDQGLKRLALGAFMTGKPSGCERVFDHGGFGYLPHEIDDGDAEAAAALIWLARRLIDEAKACRRLELSLADWCERLSRIVDTYVAPTDDADEHDKMRALRVLDELAECDVSGRKVGYRIPCEFARQQLSTLEVRRGQYLADGVAVASFLPMRPIPFRVVFVTGMGEGQFPTADVRDPLDLRLARWRPGDIRKRDQDRYMFLETLMSTRERLYLSYISRDARTGEALEPSSVVRELEYILEHGYLGADGVDALTVEHPLRRFDGAYFDAEQPLQVCYHPEAVREASAAKLGAHLRQHCRAIGAQMPPLDELRDILGDERWRSLAALLGDYGRAERPASAGPARRGHDGRTLSVSLSQLRRFLESPLQGWAQHVLGLREDDAEDLLAVDDEDFEASSLALAILLRGAFRKVACGQADGRDFEAVYRQQARLMELGGQLPSGLFRQGKMRAHLDCLSRWRDNLAAFGLEPDAPLEVIRFGRAHQHVDAGRIADSISFELPSAALGGEADGEPLRVELYGATELLWRDGDQRAASITLVTRDGARPKDFVRGFLDSVVLAAAGHLGAAESYDVIVDPDNAVSAKKVDKFRRTLRPMAQPEALDYLRTLVADLLAAPHDYLLPIEAVQKYADDDGERPVVEVVDRLVKGRDNRTSSRYGPVRHPERLDAPEAAEAIIARRYGPLLDAVEGEK